MEQMKHTPGRRAFLFGAAAALVAPAIVRAASIMPVHAMPMPVIDPVWRPMNISFAVRIVTDTPEQAAEALAAIERWQARSALSKARTP